MRIPFDERRHMVYIKSMPVAIVSKIFGVPCLVYDHINSTEEERTLINGNRSSFVWR